MVAESCTKIVNTLVSERDLKLLKGHLKTFEDFTFTKERLHKENFSESIITETLSVFNKELGDLRKIWNKILVS